jgi:uncharacterized protein (TIGR02246 family)
VVSALAGAALAALAQGRAGPPVDGALEANREIDRRFVAALAAEDAGALSGLFWQSPEATAILPGGQTARGPDEIRAAYERLFAAEGGTRVEVDRISYLVSEDGVLGVGSLTLVQGDGASERRTRISFTDFRKRVDNAWVYAHEHAQIVTELPT